MNGRAIEVDAVSKRYGDVQAVADVSLVVPPGSLFGLIGHNGAGKSTLIKLMLGLIGPDRGEIRILGQAVAGERFRETRRLIGYLPENVSFYDNLSGEETLRFYAELKGVDAAQCRSLLERVGIAHAAHRAVRTYSKGMRQRLGFAQALLGDPRVLFLDEPASGLDPEGIHQLYDLLEQLRAGGVTVILSSHNLAQIQDRVDEVALLRNGVLKAFGTVPSLRAALNLPVTIRLGVGSEGHAAVDRLTAAMPDCRVKGDGAGTLQVTCSQHDKVAVLSRLLASGIALTEVSLREPSLEEVFIEYSAAANEERRDG